MSILNRYLFLRYALLVCSIAVSTASYGGNIISKSDTADYTPYPNGGGMRVSTTFGPDGRLWRVVPEKKFIYVDYSTDLGKTFSVPVRINKKSQHIKVSRQNRPDIAVDHSGRIIVIYTVKIAHKTTQLLSISNDSGRSFSVPITLSKKAPEAISYLGRLALSPSGQVYALWLDEREHTDWRKPGYSIYSTMLGNGNTSALVNHKMVTSLCECCRIAVAFDNDNQPVLFTALFIRTISVIMVLLEDPQKARNHIPGVLPLINGKSEAARNTGPQFQLVEKANITLRGLHKAVPAKACFMPIHQTVDYTFRIHYHLAHWKICLVIRTSWLMESTSS